MDPRLVHIRLVLVIDAWGEGEQETFSIEVLNEILQVNFLRPSRTTPAHDAHLYSAVDDDRQPIDTLCVGRI